MPLRMERNQSFRIARIFQHRYVLISQQVVGRPLHTAPMPPGVFSQIGKGYEPKSCAL